MFRKLLKTLAGAAFVATAVPAMAQNADALQVGQLPPDFTLPASDGKVYTLSDFRGKQAVVVAWFPKAYTYGCTIECKSLADNGDRIRQFDVTYFMASVDPLADIKGFADETRADFPLLSDEDKTVASAWGVLGGSYARRHTVYIGKDGKVLKIDTRVNPETSAEDMVTNLQAFGVARR